jgi:hypothetical protein
VLDLVIVLAFVPYATGAGFRARRRASRNLQEYFLAGKTLPGWKAGLSMSATQFAASGLRSRGPDPEPQLPHGRAFPGAQHTDPVDLAGHPTHGEDGEGEDGEGRRDLQGR